MKTKVTISEDRRNKNRPWSVRWYGLPDFETGKSKRYSKSFRLKAQADKFAARKTIEFQDGGKRDPIEDVSLRSFLTDWQRTRTDKRPATREIYENAARRLLDYFGKTAQLSSITPRHAAFFIAEQRTFRGGDLAKASRQQIIRCCKTIFGAKVGAVHWGLLKDNPFGGLKCKELPSKRWHKMPIAEYYALLDAAPSLRERAAYALLFTGGLRLHEAFNLLWSDIDFEAGQVIIASREPTETLPPFSVKDHEGRTIPLPGQTVNLLTELQAQAPEGVPFVLLTKERFELVKVKWAKCQAERRPWRNRHLINNVLRGFKAHCRRAGIKPVGKLTVHTLRKNAAQNWANRLPINTLKKLMGHSNIRTTAKFYLQLDDEQQARAARVIQELLENESDVSGTYRPDFAEKWHEKRQGETMKDRT